MAFDKADKIPTSREVSDFHTNADTDTRAESIHHTLGRQSYQGATGDHNHDGQNSVSLLDGFVVAGSRSNATSSVISQMLAALERLGVTDNTSA